MMNGEGDRRRKRSESDAALAQGHHPDGHSLAQQPFPFSSSCNRTAKDNSFVLFGVDLAVFEPWMQALICWCGVMLCHGSAGVAQQYIVEEYGFRNTLLMGAAIPFCIALVGFCQGGFIGQRKAPLHQHAVVGILSLLTIQFSNWALLYLNYVTQVIFKSSKIIPVMIIGTVLYRQKYPSLQYVAAVLLSLGLTVFILADAETSPNFHPLGVLLISSALFADAFIGNYQELVFKRFGCSFLEASAWPALFSLLTNIVLMIVMQGYEAMESFKYAVDTPGLTIALIIYGITNYVGVWFVLAMIKHFGAAQTVFATSMRKAGSITLSYLLFPKLIIWRHVAGITLVSLGVYLHSLTKTKTGSRAMWYSIRNCFRKYKLRDESSILPL